jgi:WD40 repeat protein
LAIILSVSAGLKYLIFITPILFLDLRNIFLIILFFFRSVPKVTTTPKENVVFHRLLGHEGVIFSVNFSSETSTICTTSDDRTARLWKVETSNPDHDRHQCDWKHSKISCEQVLSEFHTSRIFSSVFCDGSVVTVGEDSSFCRWSISDRKKISWKRFLFYIICSYDTNLKALSWSFVI